MCCVYRLLTDLLLVMSRSAGDDAPTACQREAEEELGLDIKQGELQPVFSTKQSFVLRNGTYIDNEFVEVYLVERELDIEKVALLDGEVEAVKWMHWTEVKQMSLDKNSDFVPVHTQYEPFWDYVAARYPLKSA